MSDRYAQGAGDPHTGWSADFRFESVNQDRLRSGTRNLNAGDASAELAIERHTRNLNLITTLGYGFDATWSMTVRVPVVRRDHLHDLVDETSGAPSTPERWRFTRLGDVQVLARRQGLSEDLTSAYALFGGLKLPSGSTRMANRDGSRAERALQPGTGTTDAVLGVAVRHALGAAGSLMGQASVTQPLNSREDFRPGTSTELSAGWSHSFSPTLGAVLQINLRKRERDRGAQAEPENSGSTTVNISPGLTWVAGDAATLYAYVQLPVYQKVNGIQLVPSRALALGWTMDF
jgi:hypothetical protein